MYLVPYCENRAFCNQRGSDSNCAKRRIKMQDRVRQRYIEAQNHINAEASFVPQNINSCHLLFNGREAVRGSTVASGFFSFPNNSTSSSLYLAPLCLLNFSLFLNH